MKSVQLIFKRSELLYDLQNYSFVEGDIMDTNDEHLRHQVFDIAEEGNVDRVTRVLNLVHSECVEMLYPYTKEVLPDQQIVLNDIIIVPEEYVIDLLLPDEFSVSTINLLKHLVHEFLVCTVLADWMSIVNPSSQSNWEQKIYKIKSKIQTSLMSRIKKQRRRQSPF